MNRIRHAIAIDFDGCLCLDAFPAVGKPNWSVINAAKKAKEDGDALILWTCRCGEDLETALQACREWGLCFDAVNENLPERIAFFGNDTRKVGADEYWDDRAVTIKDGRTSHWESFERKHNGEKVLWVRCRKCRKERPFDYGLRYCNYCGARMLYDYER